MPNRPFHRIRIHLLSQGLPTAEDLKRRCVQPSMCIPMSSTAYHPAGRVPAIPSKPFPWPDLYHHTPMYTTVRVPTCVQNYSAAIFSSAQDMSRLQRAFDEDEAERKILMEAAEIDDVEGSLVFFHR